MKRAVLAGSILIVLAGAFLWRLLARPPAVNPLVGARLEVLPYDDCWVTGMSPNGRHLVGTTNGRRVGFLWSRKAGIANIGGLPTNMPQVMGVTDDGTVYGFVQSGRYSSAVYRGFTWSRSKGLLWLDRLTGSTREFVPLGASGDGRLFVGQAPTAHGRQAACMDGTGKVEFLALPGTADESRAEFASEDGSVILGSLSRNSTQSVVRWTGRRPKLVAEGRDPASGSYVVSALSPDGGTAIVSEGGQAFRSNNAWTDWIPFVRRHRQPRSTAKRGEMFAQAPLPTPDVWAIRGVSNEGRLAVGVHWYEKRLEPTVWTPEGGAYPLPESILAQQGGFAVQELRSLSRDGTVIAGTAAKRDSYRAVILTLKAR